MKRAMIELGGDMEGILLSIDRSANRGKVDTRNDNYGVLTIYFGNYHPNDIRENCSVSFEIRQSAAGNTYAKFLSVVERNQAVFNTEDRELWYTWGEDYEKDFIEKVVPRLNLDIRKNPEKEQFAWAIDLIDCTNRRYADLKVQETPFFSAGSAKHRYRGGRYDPTYTVTFNRKDYENYSRTHPVCDIYYWVNWKQLQYSFPNGYCVNVQQIRGVWRAPFPVMCELIQRGDVSLHAYQHRVNDDHNARDSFLFMLSDPSVFTRLL